MKIGDEVQHSPTFTTAYGVAFGRREALPTIPGRVIYIHSAGRYYTVEFTADTGETFRESYYFADRNGRKG